MVFLKSSGSASGGTIGPKADFSTSAPFALPTFPLIQNVNPLPRGWIGDWYTHQERTRLFCNLSVKSYTGIRSLFTIDSTPCPRTMLVSYTPLTSVGNTFLNPLQCPLPEGKPGNFCRFEHLTHVSPFLLLKKSLLLSHMTNRQDTTMQLRSITGSAHWSSKICLFLGHSQY